jgi:hypothetical protein
MSELTPAATKRKLAVMEASGADPAKIAEFKLSLPVSRETPEKRKTTAVAPKAAEKPAKPVDDGKLGDPVESKSTAAQGRSRGRTAVAKASPATS